MSNYTFAQKPRAVQSTGRYKYRPEEKEQQPTRNLLNDRRVVRGNTYAAQIPTQNQKFINNLSQTRAIRKAERERQRANRPVAPKEDANLKPVAGRRHMEVQTDDYLEELDDTVFEVEHGTQTEEYNEKPAPTDFPHPFKVTGVDAQTGVPQELFNFDDAVEPILQTLMGKSLDHGLNEVLDEEELKVLQQYRTQFTNEKTDLGNQIKQQEEEAKKFNEEKEAHLNKERARLRREKMVAKKVACIAASRNFLANLHNTTFTDLEEEIWCLHPTRNALATEFNPTVLKEVMSNLSSLEDAQTILDKLVKNAVTTIMSELTIPEKRAIAEEAARKAREEAEAAAAAEAARLAEEAALKAAEEAKLAAEAEAAAAAAAAEEAEEEDED